MADNDRFAMLVGVSTYDSEAYQDLPPVRADLHYMRAVLENTEIGMYNDCAMVAEPTRAEMLHAIETFLEARQPSETALLYFSGHGEFCEDDNQLYFLTRDADPNDLPGTAVPAEFLERMLLGVVTPFRAQKEALARVWRDNDRVRVGTVHAFQGGQRDVMVLSPVATHNTPPRTTHWVASQVNLWNVAVTRAKSQLITVGAHAFWQGQSGLPTLPAGRSVPLGADVGEDAGPVVTAASVTGFREELADRLQQYLAGRGITDLERAAVVGGHPVDLLFTAAGENTAVLIDSGPPPGVDPARHLRLTHARDDLLTGLPSGGYGAKACPVGRTVRVPAWRILAGEEPLAPLFD